MIIIFLVIVLFNCEETFDFDKIRSYVRKNKLVINMDDMHFESKPFEIPSYINFKSVNYGINIPYMSVRDGIVLPVINGRVLFTSGFDKQPVSIPVPKGVKVYKNDSAEDQLFGFCILGGIVHHGEVITIYGNIVAHLDDYGFMTPIDGHMELKQIVMELQQELTRLKINALREIERYSKNINRLIIRIQDENELAQKNIYGLIIQFEIIKEKFSELADKKDLEDVLLVERFKLVESLLDDISNQCTLIEKASSLIKLYYSDY